MGGVALEIALQGALLAGQAQLVIRQGEVIHTDIHIAGRRQPLDGQLQQFQLALRWRHVLAADQALGAHQLAEFGRSPEKGVSTSGNNNSADGRDLFLIPEFGYTRQINPQLSVGLAVYGNGGMNSTYPGGNTICPNPTNGQPMMGLNPLCGQGKLGVDLMQLIIAPTFAYKLDAKHSVGVSPLLVVQQFKATGLDAFAGFSMAPTQVSNTGTDRSTGVGVRLGYLGQLSDTLKLGATYSPKTKMSKFDEYAGLFAGAGSFDIPENYALGVNVQVTPAVSVAADYSRIKYSGVRSIGNASLANFANGFGAANGPGFGWQDVKVAKIGVQWQVNPAWTLRAGYNIGSNPVRSEDVYLNILAPGVVRSHLTVGATYAWSAKEELTVAAWHARRHNVEGAMPAPTRIGMSQNGFGVQYSRKF